MSLFFKKPQQHSPQRKSWLMIFNCQGYGLSNCLELLCPEIKVQFYTADAYRQQSGTINANLDHYDRIVITPDLEKSTGIDLQNRDNVLRIPPLLFYGFHPDLCWLFHNGNFLKGPTGGYHSAITYASFQAGLDERQTLELFNDNTYERLGYYNEWDRERGRLLELYRGLGLDLSRHFIEWSRKGLFMYTSNHPTIICLRDLAKSILSQTGSRILDTDLLPPDNLANGQTFPVYPEIGSRLGVRGNYLFKLAGKYEWIHLDEFTHESFKLYRSSSPLKPHPFHATKVSTAISVIEAMK